MPPISIGMTLGWIGAILALPLLATGLLLVRMGRWPKRKGTEPHCGTCDYLLVGIQSERCPECGAAVSEDTIIRGHRQRFPGLIFSGVAFIVLGAAALIPLGVATYNGVNWSQYKPAFLVMGDIESSDPRIAQRALREFARREQAGKLSLSSLHAVIERGLKMQAAGASGAFAQQMYDFIAQRFEAGRLSDQEKSRFFQQSVIPAIEIQPSFFVGSNRLLYRPVPKMHTPSGWRARVAIKEVDFDGQPQNHIPRVDSAGVGPGADALTESYLGWPDAGEHRLDVVVHIEIFVGPFYQGEPAVILSQEDRKISKAFTVRGSAAEGRTIQVHDEAAAAPVGR